MEWNGMGWKNTRVNEVGDVNGVGELLRKGKDQYMAWINIAVLLPNDIVQHSPLILLIIYLYQLIPPHIQAKRRPTGNLFASRCCWCLPVASMACGEFM